MPRVKRSRDYLFKKPGSRFWRLRLQAGGRSIERSLRTTDRLEAEALALPIIAQHKQRLIENRPRLATGIRYKVAPGDHTAPDGGRIIATPRTVIYFDANGGFVREESNTIEDPALVFPQTLKPVELLAYTPDKINRTMAALGRPAILPKDADDVMFEAYIKHAELDGYPAKEARASWHTFKTVCGKPLKDCTRDDGRKVAEHYKSQGLKTSSVCKKLMWLSSAVNFGIKEGKPYNITFNPFTGVAPKKGEDSVRRLPLSDEDMALCFANLDKLSKADQLLFRLLASTGTRLAEGFNIAEEHVEKGIRFVIVGTKTEQSERRVPLPASVLPYLPKKITGRLFSGDVNSASRRLNPWLRKIGITDPAKVIHSLRHRAQDQLRAAGCPQDIREALLGHERKTIAAGYGAGFPVTVLREWIDKVLPLATTGKGRSKLAA